MIQGLNYYCDTARHLICAPYTVENLHRMAEDLHIAPCWFHANKKHPHYDIPKERIEEITMQCTTITTRALLNLIRIYRDLPKAGALDSIED